MENHQKVKMIVPLSSGSTEKHRNPRYGEDPAGVERHSGPVDRD